jgi:hypothetical protein
MNKKNLVLCLSVALLSLSQASFAQKNILVGVQGGLSVATLTGGTSGDPLSNGWSSRLGADFGFTATVKVKGNFSVQVELNYSEQGGKKNGAQAVPQSYFPITQPADFPQIIYANLDNTNKIGYAQIPILAKFSWPLGAGLHLFVDGGPYVALLANAKNVANGTTQFFYDAKEAQIIPLTNGQSYLIDVNQDIRGEIRHVNVGVQAGVGLQKKFYVGYLTLTAGGNYGFIPIYRTNTYGQNNTAAGTIKIGYMIKI